MLFATLVPSDEPASSKPEQNEQLQESGSKKKGQTQVDLPEKFHLSLALEP
jgi:hypothetical protein